MLKKIFLTIIALTAAVHWLSKPPPDRWTTFTKKPDGVFSWKTSPKELESIRQSSTRPSRSIASILPNRHGRLLTGSGSKQFSDPEKTLPLVNRFNPNWKNLAGRNILRHLRPDSKIYLKTEGSYLKVSRGTGRLVEKIVVTSSDEDQEYTFNAVVDSESGKILSTFNRTIHENYEKKSLKIRADQKHYGR